MSPSEAKKFYHFTTQNLPDLLAKQETPEKALDELKAAWKSETKAKPETKPEETK